MEVNKERAEENKNVRLSNHRCRPIRCHSCTPKKEGKKCLVIDRRPHIAGNIYSKEIEGIQVHIYGPHIFHTAYEEVWNYVNQFASFNHFHYEPVANYKGELYNLPFNMNTFHQMWGVNTPAEALAKLEEQRSEFTGEPGNLE